MKKLFTTLSIAAALSVCTLAQVQSQDTALARIDNTKKTDAPPKETEKQSGINEEAPEQVNVEPQSTFILPEANGKNSKGSFNNKVGPQGEEIFMENGKYYYINSEGQKVKVKSTALRDKPKHS